MILKPQRSNGLLRLRKPTKKFRSSNDGQESLVNDVLIEDSVKKVSKRRV